MAVAPVPRTLVPEMVGRRGGGARASARPVQTALHEPAVPVRSQSLLDVVDSLIDKGLALDAEVVLGLADIDLICLRIGALLAAADRMVPTRAGNRRRTRATSQHSSPSHALPLAAPSATARASSTARSNSESAATEPGATAPDDASRSVIRLVLTIVEFVRQLLERQAVRRVRERTLAPEEIERLGTALMRLESTVLHLAEHHGLDAADLNLDLGPLGTLR
jgi:Gas vesicle protein K/Gas vesicle protein